ncbi:MAG: AAA family ATPase [Bdellovibrionales bacterium]|nr:AAA family ATPase [Bdellovibrionales bacterium]
MDLFEFTASQDTGSKSLAERLRPKSFDEVIGQSKILGKHSIFQSQLKSKSLKSLILWGPPGTGKTSFARALSQVQGFYFVPLSATEIGSKALKEECEKAVLRKRMENQKTILFVDEIHRLNRAEQDVLLPYVERGDVVLIGATTESISHSVNKALLSRTQVLKFEKLGFSDLGTIAEKALIQLKLEKEKFFTPEGWATFLNASGGDARRLLQSLETITFLFDNPELKLNFPLSKNTFETLLPSQVEGYDRFGSDHYDTISFFIKAMRAGKADIAIQCLAKMIKGNEDPLFIARRMVIFASEDVGLADPHALPLATAALIACQNVGLPECAINLSHVTHYLCRCAKSREAYDSWGAEMAKTDAISQIPDPRKN